MQVSKVYTDNKLKFIVDEILKYSDRGFTTAVIANTYEDVRQLFDGVSDLLDQDAVIISRRDRSIKINSHIIRFFKADYKHYCGMVFNLVFITGDIYKYEITRALYRLRGDGAIAGYILYDIDQFVKENLC